MKIIGVKSILLFHTQVLKMIPMLFTYHFQN